MISAVGMCFGTMALILVLSVFNGFEGLVTSLYNTFNPDLKVIPAEGKVFVPSEEQLAEIRALDGVIGVAKVLEDFALLQYDDKYHQCRVKAVDNDFIKINTIADTAMIRGDFDMTKSNAVLGYGVERAMRVDLYDSFEKLKIYLPKRKSKFNINPENAFNTELVNPVGTFSIQEEFDREYIFIPLPLFQNMFQYSGGEVSQLEIGFTEDANQDAVQKKIANILGKEFEVKNRFQQDANLYKVMKTEKLVVFLILTLILIVASFNIVGSLSMLVIEKTKDISILKSMGADKSLIRNIFLYEGFLLSFLGGLIGIVLAFIFCFIQQKFKIIPLYGDSLLIDAYPVKMQVMDFVLTLLVIIVITVAASYIPAQKAANQTEILK